MSTKIYIKNIAPFYCKTISPRENVKRDKFVEFYTVLLDGVVTRSIFLIALEENGENFIFLEKSKWKIFFNCLYSIVIKL